MSNGIGLRIKQLREEKGLTQQQLAKEMHVKRETVNQWENETRDLKTGYTISLADFFGVTCDYILRGIKAENVDINRELGLSDQAITILKLYNEFNKRTVSVINYLIEHDGKIDIQMAEYERGIKGKHLLSIDEVYKYLGKISETDDGDAFPLLTALKSLFYLNNIEDKNFMIMFNGQIKPEQPFKLSDITDRKRWGDSLSCRTISQREIVERIYLDEIQDYIKKLNDHWRETHREE